MEKVVYISNRQNVKMAIKLNTSPERKKCAFLMHGLGARKEYPHMRVMEEYFAKNGYNVVNIDATNSLNESGQTPSGITFTGHFQDLEDAIAWAKSQDFYAEPFALAGQSLGASACLLFAGTYPKLVNFMLLASFPWMDGKKNALQNSKRKDILENGYYDQVSKSTGRVLRIQKNYLDDMEKWNLAPYAEKIEADTFIVMGSKDSEEHRANAQQLFDILRCKKELAVLPGVPHDLANTPETESEFKKALGHIFEK